MLNDSEIVTLRFRVNDPAELHAAALVAYGPEGEDWLTNPDGTPNLERCLMEVLCEAATGPLSKIGDRPDLWEAL